MKKKLPGSMESRRSPCGLGWCGLKASGIVLRKEALLLRRRYKTIQCNHTSFKEEAKVTRKVIT